MWKEREERFGLRLRSVKPSALGAYDHAGSQSAFSNFGLRCRCSAASPQPPTDGAKRSSPVDAGFTAAAPKRWVNAHFWIMRPLYLIFVTMSSEILEPSKIFEPFGATYISAKQNHCTDRSGRNQKGPAPNILRRRVSIPAAGLPHIGWSEARREHR